MIKIYRAEAEISELIVKSTSVAYQHEISLLSSDIAQREKIKAGLANRLDGILDLPVKGGERDSDLHYVQSLLVTTNWNKNDDVFDNLEVWHARHTPQHKPTNVGHNEHEIVGHMTANWVIDENGDLIDDFTSLDNLPSLFHVVNGSVIYKAWQDEKLLERAQNLIDEINSGHKFVSMECIFTGFDYAVLTPNGQSKIIARSDETSFLTKHLRAYGGTGLYDGFKVGRLLRNITFTGKGFVDKPANPNSIIFDKDKFFNFAEAKQAMAFSIRSVGSDKKGVYINLDNNSIDEENLMTVDIFKEQNAELKSKNDELAKQLVEANERLAKSSVEKLEKHIIQLGDELKASQAKIEELQISVEQHSTKSDEAIKELAEIRSIRDALQTELDEVKANELKTNRISTLVDGGIDKDVAKQKVDLYSNLSDEQFIDLSNELIEIATIKKDTQVEDSVEEVNADTEDSHEDVSDEEVDDAEAETEVLDNVEQIDDVDLSTTSESNDDNDIRSKLSRALAKMLGRDDDNSEEEN